MPTPNILGAEDFRHLNSQTGRGSPARYAGVETTIPLSRYGVAPRTTLGVAFAWDPLAASFAGFNIYPLILYEGGSGGIQHLVVYVDGTGHIVAKRGGTTLDTSVNVFPAANAYYHIEIVSVTGDTGSVEIKVDGVTWLTLSGVDTKNGGTGLIDTLVVSSNSRPLTDLIITDGSGFIGDKATAYAPPNLAGTYSAGTAVGAGTLLDCVDDVTADDDTSYIQLAKTSLPRKVSFEVTLPTCTAVLAVIPRARARKDDGGVNAGRLLVLSGATETDGGADIDMLSTYAEIARVEQEDPDDPGNPFTSGQTIEVGLSREV